MKYLILTVLVIGILMAFVATGIGDSYTAKVFEVGPMKAGPDPWNTELALLITSVIFCMTAGVLEIFSSRIRRRAHVCYRLGGNNNHRQ